MRWKGFSLLSGEGIQRFIFVYPSTCFPLVFVILFVCFVDASRNFEFRSLIASGRGHTYVWFVVIKVGAFVCLWLISFLSFLIFPIRFPCFHLTPVFQDLLFLLVGGRVDHVISIAFSLWGCYLATVDILCT